MIEIKKSKNADTRTCDWSKVSKKELLKNSDQHIQDVKKGLAFFGKKLIDAAWEHDHTKLSQIDSFYKDFQTGFETTDWWKMHQEKERHHFNTPEYIQDDVNLIDILEMITDGVMAGLARSGEYRKEDMPTELLVKAFNNTIDLLLSNVCVSDNL